MQFWIILFKTILMMIPTFKREQVKHAAAFEF